MNNYQIANNMINELLNINSTKRNTMKTQSNKTAQEAYLLQVGDIFTHFNSMDAVRFQLVFKEPMNSEICFGAIVKRLPSGEYIETDFYAHETVYID